MKALVEVEFKTPGLAGKALKAISHEVKFKRRGSAEISKNGKMLAIRISAGDFATLRAMVNGYMRLVSVMLSVLEVGGIRKTVKLKG